MNASPLLYRGTTSTDREPTSRCRPFLPAAKVPYSSLARQAMSTSPHTSLTTKLNCTGVTLSVIDGETPLHLKAGGAVSMRTTTCCSGSTLPSVPTE